MFTPLPLNAKVLANITLAPEILPYEPNVVRFCIVRLVVVTLFVTEILPVVMFVVVRLPE